jgi:hypothetical protein
MVQEKQGRTALLEISFAAMGVLKLVGLERRLFRRWGMTSRQMRRIGAIETAGAIMVANDGTRPIGAAGLAVISAMMLAVELREGEAELILPRLAVTLLAIRTAMAGGSKLRARVEA